VKLKKSQLKELIKQAIVEDLMDKEIKNPKTGNMIKVRTALQLPDEHPANKKAKGMVAKKPIKKDSGEFSIDKVMSKKIGKDTVGDILDNPKHPNYDKAEKYASQFNPDDEKVVSGEGPKVKGPKPGGEFSIDKVMDATIGKEKVSDLLGDEEHPDYEAALKYVMGFNPDDEKVISGAGEKAKKKAKDIDKQSMKAADDANAKMDAAEKAAKKKKKGKVKSNPFSESKIKRYTVKEVRMWMKKLEENRYKKVYNADARRVSWMVNNEGVEISEMPKSMSKKWTKAQYGRERYLATEFVKSKSEQMTEGKLRKVIREILKEQLNLNEYVGAGKPIPSNKAKYLFVPENQMIRFSRVYKKLIQKGFVYIGDQSKEKKKINKHYTVTIDKKMYNDVLDSLMSKSFKIKT
jgi:hypothetical protein